jgi:hypothetical protein
MPTCAYVLSGYLASSCLLNCMLSAYLFVCSPVWCLPNYRCLPTVWRLFSCVSAQLYDVCSSVCRLLNCMTVYLYDVTSTLSCFPLGECLM